MRLDELERKVFFGASIQGCIQSNDCRTSPSLPRLASVLSMAIRCDDSMMQDVFMTCYIVRYGYSGHKK